MSLKLHDVPASHPRRVSLELREKLILGLETHINAQAGLIAHGRGEAFDYILGEETTEPARAAIRAAAAHLLAAHQPVISVNGNVAALAPTEAVALSLAARAGLEVNLYYRSAEREQAIAAALVAHGAKSVLGIGERASERVPNLESERGRIDPEGIYSADVVFLALEDGDRTEAVKKMGKKVIAVDLNPFSRTAQFADVTIVDNVARALPLLVKEIELLRQEPSSVLLKIVHSYDNKKALGRAIRLIYKRLRRLSRRGVFLKNPAETGDKGV
jgi:4-phosphopantoate---beta-alanine ligase